MEKNYVLVFDEVIVKQLKKAAKNGNIKEILIKMFDKLELIGPNAGELIDSQLFIYEIKAKHPPIRLYYVPSKTINEIKIFEFEMKTSPEKQNRTINMLRKRLSKS
ncbi:hypothetical protein JXB27_03670 [Candidatus Woesearchaeota archaeon]|nr:hypothetical protein [Candidatus Woesearchaeota archaeon]